MATTTGWLKPGKAVRTAAVILKASHNVKLQEPARMTGAALPLGTPGRIHSEEKGGYVVWLLEEVSSNTIILEAPLHMMGSLFEPATHGLFPHFAG